MAPIKFEENIKNKLEHRTLTPSTEGWSKLSQRLDAEDNKSKKPMFWWLSIAAGLLIMIAISTQFFSTNESKTILPKMVEEEVIDKQLNNEILEPIDKELIELVNEEKSIEEKEEVLPTVNAPQILNYKKVINKKPEAQTQLANESKPIEKSIDLNKEELLNNEVQNLLDDAKMNIAVAEAFTTIKSENNTVTDQEIDSLLKIASKELFKDNLQKETLMTVDANTLLMSVEEDMGQSFRSKVFEALKESYGTVKTAVANRNN